MVRATRSADICPGIAVKLALGTLICTISAADSYSISTHKRTPWYVEILVNCANMSMPFRKRYHGLHRAIVLAFDVGTTYSGVSYCILDPDEVPQIKGVTRYV